MVPVEENLPECLAIGMISSSTPSLKNLKKIKKNQHFTLQKKAFWLQIYL